MRGRVAWTVLVAGLVVSLVGGTVCSWPSEAERACTSSGGTVETAECCEAVGDFPNLCATGACGCAPEFSHEVKVCDCGEGMCFDGESCVPSD